MSRIGRNPISLPSGVTVNVDDKMIAVKGPKGELSMPVMPNISVSIEDGILRVARANDQKATRAAHGMVRAMVNNTVVGVTEGFAKQLEIIGVGYRAAMQGSKLVLSLGYSHPIEVDPPKGIEITVENPTNLTVKGIDKQVVGQLAANIRGYRPPEPYLGKGIRYKGELVVRKAGKTSGK